MTLGMGLVVVGFLSVYQRAVLTSGSAVPAEFAWLGAGVSFGLPNSLVLFVPLAATIIIGLRRTGYGRLLYALGDNETAARLSGVRVWQVIVVLYGLSGLLAGVAGLMYAGLIRTVSLQLVEPFLLPSVAAAVIGGTSIFGGRGGYAGSIVGSTDPDDPDQPADGTQAAGGLSTDHLRGHRARGRGCLHATDRGPLRRTAR